MRNIIFSLLFYFSATTLLADPYIIKATQPTKLFTILVDNMTGPERTMIGTLQGLIANSQEEQIYIRLLAGGYDTWLNDLVDNYGIERVDMTDAFELLDYFKDNLNGYLLYQVGNGSINSATSLAGIEQAIVVEQSIENQVIALGLNLIHDMRNVEESWVYDNYKEQLNPDVVIEQREEFEHTFRDYAILSNAFTFFDGNSDFRNHVLDGLNPNSVMMGWGDAWQGEDVFIRAGSERGIFTIPSDHTHNLSPLSGFPSIQQTQQSPPHFIADSNTHYVSFLFTDGDNLQWTLGNLQSDTKWFASPFRGNFNMGWGIPPSLVHAAPTVMKWYYDNAFIGPGYDNFVVGPSGGGYMYPSLYPPEDLALHVDELSQWMSLGDLNIIEILDFGSQTYTDIWDVYTAKEQIDGLIYLEYGDHSEPNGTTIWSNGKPVLSPRIKLWNGLPGSDQQTIINTINQSPRDPSSPFGYSMVIVGVWEHSLEEIQSIINGFTNDTQVVTPKTMVQLMTDNIPHDVSFSHDYTSTDFETPELNLVGDAFWTSDYDELFMPNPSRLRLTYNSDGLMGSAWSTEPFDASKSWTSIFRFQISYAAQGGADGLGFHIQKDGIESNPGHEGGNLSSPKFSVVIDTWNNGTEGTDESLRILLDGEQIYINDLLDFDLDPNPGSSSTVFRMELNYINDTQELVIRFFDEGSSDVLYDTVQGIDLRRLVHAWAGFSAVTGTSTQNHDIRSWIHNGASPQTSEPGDINEDGNLNIFDIILLVDLILDGIQDDSGDINQDGIINISDIVMLVDWILNHN